jgi:hypothetical protein
VIVFDKPNVIETTCEFQGIGLERMTDLQEHCSGNSTFKKQTETETVLSIEGKRAQAPQLTACTTCQMHEQDHPPFQSDP